MSAPSIRTERIRGVAALVKDAVLHGSSAVERVQLATAARPFAVLEAIPVVALPAALVHVVHDASVKTVHGCIRLVTRTVALAIRRPATMSPR